MADRISSTNDRFRLVLQDDGNLVLYHADGSALWATHTAQPGPPPDPGPPDPPPGGALEPLVIEGQTFRTLTGARYSWRGVTAFRLLDLVSSGQIDAARAYLAWAQASGFTVVRTLTTAFNGFMDLPPEYGRRDLLQTLALAASYGLRVEVVALSDTAVRHFDWADHARQVAGLLHEHPSAFYEFANEPFHHTQVWASASAMQLQTDAADAVLGQSVLWAAGSAADDEAHMPGGRYVTRHLDRGRDLLNQVRRVKELWSVQQGLGRPVINDEPLGADEQDGAQTGRQRSDQPWVFYALGALGALFGVGGTFHLQAGLSTVVPGPVQQRCARAFLEGMAILPDAAHGLGAYRNIGHAGSPVLSADLEDPDGGPIVRAYSMIETTDARRGLTVVLHRPDICPPHSLRWGNQWEPQGDLSPYPHVRVLPVVRP